ncbi:MAG: AAA domain-containing protein, partial [candidate division Zixibacteria bacterium]|nr:AAA domain-containing protein [candidate division Zixibacteria bacterium]
EVFNVLLQVLDDGRLTDAKGRTVDFKNTVIIMTSNIGSAEIAEYASDSEKQRQAIETILRQTFRPEFLNRVDDIIIFQHLSREEIASIVQLQMARVAERLAGKGITIITSEAAAGHLAQAGFDKVFGARPLKRLIQNEILDELSLQIIEGKIVEGETVTIDFSGGRIVFKKGK